LKAPASPAPVFWIVAPTGKVAPRNIVGVGCWTAVTPRSAGAGLAAAGGAAGPRGEVIVSSVVFFGELGTNGRINGLAVASASWSIVTTNLPVLARAVGANFGRVSFCEAETVWNGPIGGIGTWPIW
jgi:hypothetical protein